MSTLILNFVRSLYNLETFGLSKYHWPVNSNHNLFILLIHHIHYLLLSIVCGTVTIIIKYLGIKSILILLTASSLIYFGSYFMGLLIVREPIAFELVAYAKKYFLKEK